MKEYLGKLFKNRYFKVFLFILSASFLIYTIFIAIKPEPFLKFGYPGIFIYNIFSSGIFLIPILADKFNLFGLAITSAVGMTFNESINWVMGATSTVIIEKSKNEERVEKIINKYGIYGIFFLALIPFPFDIVGIVAGRIGMKYIKFIIPIFFARIIRFLILGILFKYT